MDKYLRRREVCICTGLSYSTIRRLELRGEFPRRRQLGPRSVGWLRSEVETWLVEASPVNNEAANDSERAES